MHMIKRYKQLKSMLNLEMEADKEIRSDLEDKITRNIIRIYENRRQK